MTLPIINKSIINNHETSTFEVNGEDDHSRLNATENTRVVEDRVAIMKVVDAVADLKFG